MMQIFLFQEAEEEVHKDKGVPGSVPEPLFWNLEKNVPKNPYYHIGE